KKYLDEAHIGTLQLADCASVALNMWDGDFVIPRGNRIAKVPNFDVLKDDDALVSYLNEVTQLQIKSLVYSD
ncbi:MAG: hypothetical protein QF793_03190, partial [Candidatus Peribacteraceae bacterium]|nr:hypothetical protein [Candidatus Peribacteraceae bacterium]